jgi:hypothetical protein
MLTAAILVFTTLICIGGFMLGLIVGWMSNLYYHEHLEQQVSKQINHPEFYDAEGNVIENQVLTLRFESKEDEFYDD